MRKLAVCLIFFLLGCASQHPPRIEASPEEIQTRYRDYANCLVPRVKQIDDGISDARTIASGAVGACPQQWENFFRTLTLAENDAVKRTLRGKQTQMQIDMALTVVLQIRASTRGTPR